MVVAFIKQLGCCNAGGILKTIGPLHLVLLQIVLAWLARKVYRRLQLVPTMYVPLVAVIPKFHVKVLVVRQL
jgi:hypothetical protein